MKNQKKRLIIQIIIIIILLLIPLTFSYTNELNSNEIREITDNGQKGFFISNEYWHEIRLELNEFYFLEKKIEKLEENYSLLESVNINLKKQLKFAFVKNISLAILTGITIVSTILAIVIPCVMYVRFRL